MTEAGAHVARTADAIHVLDHLMAGGTMLAAQLPGPSLWSPERRLAAAVLASALVEIRDHHDDPRYARSVRRELEWIAANDRAWAFSFVRLCELFHLEPNWVRAAVRRWMAEPTQLASTRPKVSQIGKASAQAADEAPGDPGDADADRTTPRRTTHAAMA